MLDLVKKCDFRSVEAAGRCFGRSKLRLHWSAHDNIPGVRRSDHGGLQGDLMGEAVCREGHFEKKNIYIFGLSFCTFFHLDICSDE